MIMLMKNASIFLQYLNSGPGGIAGAFIHRSQHDRPKLCGWWSNREDTRFEMRHSVDPASGADAYRLCNPPPSLVALVQASLEVSLVISFCDSYLQTSIIILF